MARSVKRYFCQACGVESGKWNGRCNDCGAWNSLEQIPATALSVKKATGHQSAAKVQLLSEVPVDEEIRNPLGMAEMDRVLGGGLVQGSVNLIGGDPGIGKSTLMMQCLAKLAEKMPTLYVSGEESLRQISLRARRLQLGESALRLLAETCVENILHLLAKEKPQVVVIDSIQSIYSNQLPSAPGGVAQLRESTALLLRYIKQHDIALFLVGHVTKEGALAGPRILEHMVDTVFYFEGDPDSRFRLIRAIKNRFGTVNEVGIFAMTEQGLKAVSNPSAIFLSRHEKAVAGSVITVIRKGTRPLLVEIQALVDEVQSSAPRRVTAGIDATRLSMMLGVLSRHAGHILSGYDVFANVVGGIKSNETALDLPLLMAIVSSLRNHPLPMEWVCFGEIGLAGEIRPVPHGETRLQEAQKHGFKKAIVPFANSPRQAIKGLQVHAVQRLTEAIEILSS